MTTPFLFFLFSLEKRWNWVGILGGAEGGNSLLLWAWIKMSCCKPPSMCLLDLGKCEACSLSRSPDFLISAVGAKAAISVAVDCWGDLCKTTEFVELRFVPLSFLFLNVSPISCSFPCLPDTQQPLLLSETNVFSSPHKAPLSPSIQMSSLEPHLKKEFKIYTVSTPMLQEG